MMLKSQAHSMNTNSPKPLQKNKCALWGVPTQQSLGPTKPTLLGILKNLSTTFIWKDGFGGPHGLIRTMLRDVSSKWALMSYTALFSFLEKRKDKEVVKRELLAAIQPLDRGAQATADDLANIDKIARELESLNPTKEPLKLSLLNGKWRLVYTTSESVLRKQWPKILRPNGPIYQAINTDTLRAQNLETWPFFNQVTANLSPLTAKKVAVNFDYFKIGGLISVKMPERARGELEITYLDDEVRVSRGDKGSLFVLLMDDPTYRVPT
ncbi:unnamed protein product [Sphagnum jensenii]|uniref:Plastid lipid-associated protein/fibrillin conserved domain-containing protein n=1 Tax=Sphagnum jensenii TaxID=128206 RepID=A0ABP0VRX5_9BRYO